MAAGTRPWSLSPTGTAYGLPRWLIIGIRWTSERPPCTSVGSRRARPVRIPRRRTTRPAAAPARTGAQVAVRVHLGAGSAVHHGGVCPLGRTCRLRSEAGVQSPPARPRSGRGRDRTQQRADFGRPLIVRWRGRRTLYARRRKRAVSILVSSISLAPTRGARRNWSGNRPQINRFTAFASI